MADTRYYVRFIWPSGSSVEQSFTSATLRALAIISYSTYAVRVETWEGF